MSTVVKDVHGRVWHEVVETVPEGYKGKCGLLVLNGRAKLRDNGISDCAGCRGEVPEPAKPRTPAKPHAPHGTVRAATGRPWGRVARDLQKETVVGYQHAHKAVVAALEWSQRGADGQFVNEALDQANMAYRFLQELLVANGRIPDPDLDTE